MSEILLSVLIPSLTQRKDRLTSLLEIFARQADPRLEVLVFADNFEHPLGEKRNSLMDRAAGRYLCHIDDDERVSPHFFASLLPELQHDVDVIGYNASAIFNGLPPFTVRTIFGAANEQPRHLPDGRYSDIVRNFWHWCCWRTTLDRRFKFPDHAGDEDWQWLKQVYPHVRTHRKLEETLFTHVYDHSQSTFDGHKKAATG